MATWKELIEDEMKYRGETWDDLVSCTLSQAEAEREFDSGYGGVEGYPFTAWTEQTVYFPVVYDGAEWVGFVSRHPDATATGHVGGW